MVCRCFWDTRRKDANKPSKAAARFRSGVKKDIYIALAIGWAGQLMAVGSRAFRSQYMMLQEAVRE